jgi:hypothetical protein
MGQRRRGLHLDFSELLDPDQRRCALHIASAAVVQHHEAPGLEPDRYCSISEPGRRRTCTNLARLERWLDRAVTAVSVADVLKVAGGAFYNATRHLICNS